MFRIAFPVLLAIAVLTPAAAWPADPADPAAVVPPAGHRSALNAYRGHATEPVGAWRDANDRVGHQPDVHAHGAGEATVTQNPSMDSPAAQDHDHSAYACLHREAEPADNGTSSGHGCQHPVKKERSHDHH